MSVLTCTHPGCDKPAPNTMCRYHLQQARAATYEPCTYPGCDHRSATVQRGLCVAHKRQLARGAELAPLRESGRGRDACKRGHPFTPENTYRQEGRGRQCKQCRRDAARGRKQATRSTVATVKPKPKKPAKPVLPPGWFGPAKTRREQVNTDPVGGKGIDTIPSVPPTPPDVLAAALACLTRHDALDLADMLGIPTQTDKESAA